MGWGKAWDKENIEIIPPSKPENQFWSNGAIIHEEVNKEDFKKQYEQDWFGIDLGSNDSAVLTTFEDGKIKHRVIPPEEFYNNLKPTHDPYVNLNAQIYYECACGEILDPGTKSFAALNNCASEKGWKIRFGDKGYTLYCVKCGENVE